MQACNTCITIMQSVMATIMFDLAAENQIDVHFNTTLTFYNRRLTPISVSIQIMGTNLVHKSRLI